MSIYEQSSPRAISEIPPWAWATTLGMILCAMAMGAAMCWTIAWQLDRQAIEEHRALLTAQALAQAAAKAGIQPIVGCQIALAVVYVLFVVPWLS